MNKELIAIFDYLEREKGIKRDIVIAAIRDALVLAARNKMPECCNITAELDPKTGAIDVVARKEVVEHVTVAEEEISLAEARAIDPECEVGDWVDLPIPLQELGRIAAQTAHQFISQKLRGAERDVIHEEYRHRMHELISGSVKRVAKGDSLIIDLGKVAGFLPRSFYPKSEEYHVGDRIQALLYEVRDTENGGAEVLLSRAHPEFVKQLFLQEVPELQDETIVIERIVRDPGYRTKIAVRSNNPKVDPVGACVGVRGNRIKHIIRELNNEKIDIIPFVEDRLTLLENALAPIEIRKIHIDEQEKKISIIVEDEEYPMALGKRGMNAALNGQLIDRQLEVQKMSQYRQVLVLKQQELAEADDPTLDEPLVLEGISSLITQSLISAGYDTPRKVLATPLATLSAIPEISKQMIDAILEQLYSKRG